MKAICPISGIPFRTYDSLTIQVAVDHPIFSIPYEQLILLLEDVHIQEEHQLNNISEETSQQQDAAIKATTTIKDLTNMAVEAIHEKNWRNPIFKLYQTKHLVMLALMKHAELLENELGYAARPSPQIIDAHFWKATELFTWAATIANPNMQKTLPKYRISKQTENMENFSEYIELLAEVKKSIGSRYRTFADENKLKNMERALAILSKRRAAYKQNITAGKNNLAARWALMITRAPKDIYPFWYAILSNSSTNITYNGVKVGEIIMNVTIGDLRELRDYLEDNLIGPRGEHKKFHEDDLEYYFMARQSVLNIIRRHIAILEQGTSTYKIVNVAVGEDILSSSDDKLEKKGLEIGLNAKPQFQDFLKKIDFIKAVAAWRNDTKNKLLEEAEKAEASKPSTKKSEAQYDIL